ncbi:MAG: hypothetical protein ABJF88_11125 [Rhodothermales bacterium]
MHKPHPCNDIDTVSLNTPVLPVLDALYDPDRYTLVSKNGESAYYTAKHGGMKVLVTPHYARVTGSIAKYVAGSNLHGFDPAAVGPALSEIEEALGFPEGELLLAKVTRLDVGANLVLDRPVSEYLDAMCTAGRLHPVRYRPETLYFQNTMRELALYDKIAEAR